MIGALRGWFTALGGGERRAPLPVRDALSPATAGASAGLDRALLAVIVALLVSGIVMVYSASIALPGSRGFASYGPNAFLWRHLLAVGIGGSVALALFQVPVAVWEKWAPAVFLLALALLVAVLFVGEVRNKARRWIPLGFMNFQPAEFAKLAIAMYAANYMVRRMDDAERGKADNYRRNFLKAVWPMVLAVTITGSLLLRQPDMGSFLVIAVIAMGVLFLGGVNLRGFLLIAAMFALVVGYIIAFDEMRRERIFAYLDPWSEQYAQGKGYQLTHSLMAFGRGGIFGQGLGLGAEKLRWLPEAHNDFLLAVIGEELGLVGVLVLMAAYFWMVRRIFTIGRQAVALDRLYAGLMSQGVGLWLGVQGFVNMGVNLGLLPTKGLTLPLLSFGGSAMLVTLAALAMVLRVDAENRALMRGGRP